LFSKNKILVKAPKLVDKSPTVFGCITGSRKKNNYGVVDTRLVTCFNNQCKNTKTKVPKMFHHVCYMHMMGTTPEDEMDTLYYKGKDDKLLSLVNKNIDMDAVNSFIDSTQSNLIFPFCGKRCYNSLSLIRKKNQMKGDSEYARIQNWEKDGTTTKRTLMKVLIDWFTTEENCSSYFGGVDSQGNTSANQKETYHLHIRDLIHRENGSERSTESIKNKITRIMSQYKEANERMNNTGDGLEGIEYSNFQEYIVNNVCKYYFLLDPVLKNRPNVRPWVTNESPMVDTSLLSSSDDESMISDSSIEEKDDNHKSNEEMLDAMINQNSTDDEYKYSGSTVVYKSDTTSNKYLSSTSNTTDSNTNARDDSSLSSKVTHKVVTPKRNTKKAVPKKVVAKVKMSPIEARKKLKSRKKTIAKKKNGSSSGTNLDNDERDMIIETRERKIKLETDKLNYMKSVESEKLRIDNERLKMEMQGMKVKDKQEQGILILQRFNIFKQRQEIKRQYPDMTDEYLEQTFPFPE
jgi:hypothetical protein